MTIKQTLEDNVFYVLCGLAIAAFCSGWVACELVRVSNKTERIDELMLKVKDGTITIEPYLKKIEELNSRNESLEIDLNNLKVNLMQLQETSQVLNRNNEELQSDLKVSASRCSIIALTHEIEGKKEFVEKYLAQSYGWNSESPRIDDYKRQISEYQTRLIALTENLTCLPH